MNKSFKKNIGEKKNLSDRLTQRKPIDPPWRSVLLEGIDGQEAEAADQILQLSIYLDRYNWHAIKTLKTSTMQDLLFNPFATSVSL